MSTCLLGFMFYDNDIDSSPPYYIDISKNDIVPSLFLDCPAIKFIYFVHLDFFTFAEPPCFYAQNKFVIYI
jgi:hypothetical protein